MLFSVALCLLTAYSSCLLCLLRSVGAAYKALTATCAYRSTWSTRNIENKYYVLLSFAEFCWALLGSASIHIYLALLTVKLSVIALLVYWLIAIISQEDFPDADEETVHSLTEVVQSAVYFKVNGYRAEK